MSGFYLHLQDASKYERVEGVRAFVGTDETGSFSIWPHHERFITALGFGLARYYDAEQQWEYIAVPGAIVYFHENELYLNTRRYYRAADFHRISEYLQDQLVKEEQDLQKMHQSIHKMEEEIFRRLWKLRKIEAYP